MGDTSPGTQMNSGGIVRQSSGWIFYTAVVVSSVVSVSSCFDFVSKVSLRVLFK